MKALTLTQPYATLIALGAKRIETRSWATSYRGPLAIHAAQGLGPVGGKQGLINLCATAPFKGVLEPLWSPGTFFAPESLVFGAIIAVCELVDCRPTRVDWTDYEPWSTSKRGAEVWYVPPPEPERAFGDYSAGRFAWLLADVRALPQPIPAKGALGLWEWEPPDGVL